MTNRFMYAFACKFGERTRVIRVYADSAIEAFRKLAECTDTTPQQVAGIRVRQCTNKTD